MLVYLFVYFSIVCLQKKYHNNDDFQNFIYYNHFSPLKLTTKFNKIFKTLYGAKFNNTTTSLTKLLCVPFLVFTSTTLTFPSFPPLPMGQLFFWKSIAIIVIANSSTCRFLLPFIHFDFLVSVVYILYPSVPKLNCGFRCISSLFS